MSDPHDKDEIPAGPAPLHGLLAEYDSPTEILHASKKVRDAGFTRWDTYTPFPVHGIEKAMGIKMTILPWLVLGAGITGLITAITLQWWTNAYDYKWLISGKPFWSIPANVPIMFELTVLFSVLTTLTGMLMLNNLPLPAHPLDLVKRFGRSTDDKFFLLIEAADPKFDEGDTRRLLESTHPVALEDVKEDRVTSDKLPTFLVYGMIILTVAAAVPFALAAKARFTRNTQPRIHAVGDMDWQPKYKAQRMNPIFADQRASRPDEPGTVAVGELREDDHLYRGKDGNVWASTFPDQIPLDEKTMARGKERFGIYCTPCHGEAGRGDGMIAKRADELQQKGITGAWVPPTDITLDNLRYQPVGELFNSITHGVRNMPAYGTQITTEDRWAIVLYVRALQRSHSGSLQDVAPAERASLNR
jgi:mono/diheme cytochrome c family protein